jgi:hypothetical protein
MIHAKATGDASALSSYRSKTFDLFDNIFYTPEASGRSDILETAFRFSIDDENGPHFPIPIFDDDRYRLFDPVRDRIQLTQSLYEKSFQKFIEFCVERLQLDEDSES